MVSQSTCHIVSVHVGLRFASLRFVDQARLRDFLHTKSVRWLGCVIELVSMSDCDRAPKNRSDNTRGNSIKGIICPEQCNLTNKNLVFGII